MNAVRRARRWVVVLLALVGLYAILGFLVAPPIVRGQLQRRLGAALDRPVTIERVRINPFACSLSLEGLRVMDHDEAELASWRLAYVNFDPLTSLWRREWHAGQVRLVDPRQRLVIDASGRINIADLLESSPAEEPDQPEDASEGPPALGVSELAIEGWTLDFTDRSLPHEFHTEIGPMRFTVHDFSTRPGAASPYQFSGSTDADERFSWSGSVTAQPLGSTGRIELTGFSIPKHMPFLEQQVTAQVTSGRVGIATNYEVKLGGEPVVRLTDLTASLDGLTVAAPGGEGEAIALEQMAVAMPEADLRKRTAEVARIGLRGLRVHALRDPDGTLDLLSLVAAPEAQTPADADVDANASAASPLPPPAGDPGPAPSVRVAEIVVEDSAVTLEDRSTVRPAQLALDQITLHATNAGTDLDREVGVDLKMRWAGKGPLAVQGVVRPLPFAARLEVHADHLDLAPLEAYLAPFTDVRLRQGLVRVEGTVTAAQPAPPAWQVGWQGDVALDDLATADGRGEEPLVSWKALALTGTRFSLTPMEFHADTIKLEQPVAAITVADDGTINLAAFSRTAGSDAGLPTADQAQAVAAASDDKKETVTSPAGSQSGTTSERLAAATQAELPFEATVDNVSIVGGDVRIEDRSVTPAFTTELRDFSGTIRGLSSAELARADVDLKGSLDGAAPLHITGVINPLARDRYSDLEVTWSNIDLPLFTPYSGRFLGQKIQKGKLQLDLNYKVSQNVLEGENQLVFDQFYLGDKVASDEALNLPIGLALALLRNREGKIPLDVPVRGNLDDPDFKYGRVVWQAIGNIVMKAATSPFALLGGMFGGGSEDLSYLEFASGSAELSESAEKKLEVMARALYERPALRLEISAPPAPEQDREGLREARLEQMLAAQVPAQAPDAAQAGAAVGGDQADTERRLRALFAARFPDEVATAPPSTDARADDQAAQPEAEEQPGFLKRMARRIFGRDEAPPASDDRSETSGTAEPETTAAPPAPPSVEEMRARILDTIELTAADFEALAASRARAVRDRLLADGRIEPERVFLVDQPTVPAEAKAPAEGGRVYFGLK